MRDWLMRCLCVRIAGQSGLAGPEGISHQSPVNEKPAQSHRSLNSFGTLLTCLMIGMKQ